MISAPGQRQKLSRKEIVTQREVGLEEENSVPQHGQGQSFPQSTAETSSIETLRLFTSSSIYFGIKRMDGVSANRNAFERSYCTGRTVLGTSYGDTLGAIFSAISSDGSVKTVAGDLVTRCSYSAFWRGF